MSLFRTHQILLAFTFIVATNLFAQDDFSDDAEKAELLNVRGKVTDSSR